MWRCHGWLEEGEASESSYSEEKAEVKVEKLSLPCEDLALPFYQTRGQTTLAKREKKRKRWCMHNSCKGEVFSHAAGPFVVLGPAACCCHV
jgi:hypothetical protein